MLGKIKETLQEQGHNVRVLAPTHAAARIVSGSTLHHFVARFAMLGAFKGWLLIDEISMVVLPILACLDQLRLIDCKIICFGDWDQLESVSPSWRGVSVDPHAFRHSRLYKWWSDRTKFVLQRCRRSDQGHFDFYTGLSMNLPQAIAASRRKYGTTNDDADLHLTISHKRRRDISGAKQSKAAIGKECLTVPLGDDPAYKCFVGTRLICSATGGKFVNGARYLVNGLTPQLTLVDEMTGLSFLATLEAVSRQTLLAWAIVYNKAQACTIEGTVCLHDMNSKYFRRCHLYVGLSRVTNGANVFVGRH